MKQKTNEPYSGLRILLINTTLIACAASLLESCSCEKTWYCNNPAVCGDAIVSTRPPGDNGSDWREAERCEFKIFSMLYEMRFGSSIPSGPAVQTSKTDSTRQNKAPIIIDGPKPGEYFATTITAGPLLSFKSSNEEYGGGYGNHKPGVGLHVGLSTVLPFNKHWAVATSMRFTQKNASEELGYSEPGGGGMQFTDKYSYNYLGGAILAQYRAGKHVSFVAGPEVNYLVSASVKNGGSSGTGEKQTLTKNSNKAGLDILAGIKLEIPAGNNRSKWGLQILYDHRLSRLNKKKDEFGFDVPAYKMKSVQLGLAYSFCASCGKKK